MSVRTVADRFQSGPKIPGPGVHAEYIALLLSVGIARDSLLANRICEGILQMRVLSQLVLEFI